MKLTLLTLVIGAVSGLIAALCGVGGGIIMVPAFVSLLQLNHKQAIATSLAVIIPTACIATLKNGTGSGSLINWSIVLPAALGASVAAYFGVDLMKSLSNPVLSRIFALLLIITGVRMLLEQK